MDNRIHDKLIIGAGAAGLMAAYSACKSCSENDGIPDVMILEGKEVAGKKLSATGNGKCNFTNMFQDKSCYRSNDSEKAYRIINRFDNRKTIELFNDIGIMSTQRKGYCYPIGEQARTFRDVLNSRAVGLGVVINTEKKVEKIEKKDGIFSVQCSDSSVYYAKKLIVCSGGAASPVFGTDGSLFVILKKMGISIIKPRPALCGLKTDSKILKLVDGVRLKCSCTLFSHNQKEETGGSKQIYEEDGEIIFNKNGVNGIPIMNMSRYAINEIETSSKVSVVFDFFPQVSLGKLKEYLLTTVISSRDAEIGVTLSALINDKLLKALFKDLTLSYNTSPRDYDVKTVRTEMKKLAEMLKAFRMNITGDMGFENAQTTQGGVSLKEIDEKTMESYKIPGLYFAGEVLDVDGKCGGYNLQWAWTTGYLAGRN